MNYQLSPLLLTNFSSIEHIVNIYETNVYLFTIIKHGADRLKLRNQPQLCTLQTKSERGGETDSVIVFCVSYLQGFKACLAVHLYFYQPTI